MILDRSNTALVVDSTADLPDALAADPNLTMVPLTVFFGDEAYLDWVELRPEQFYEKLATYPALPKTSQPAPAVWTELYGRLLEKYERVYSVHLSAEFSGTFQTARMAAEQLTGGGAGSAAGGAAPQTSAAADPGPGASVGAGSSPGAAVDAASATPAAPAAALAAAPAAPAVKVVDSRLATGGFALLVDRIMERIDRGIAEEELDAYIDYFHRNKTFIFLPTTLDYLYKGGRIGRASHLMGTLLNIKPVLSIDEGVADVYKKVRGVPQALQAMRDCLLERTAPGSDVYANLSHGLDLPLMERLQELVTGITDRRIHLRPYSVVGSVIGTYAGPKAVGLGFIQE